MNLDVNEVNIKSENFSHLKLHDEILLIAVSSDKLKEKLPDMNSGCHRVFKF